MRQNQINNIYYMQQILRPEWVDTKSDLICQVNSGHYLLYVHKSGRTKVMQHVILGTKHAQDIVVLALWL